MSSALPWYVLLLPLLSAAMIALFIGVPGQSSSHHLRRRRRDRFRPAVALIFASPDISAAELTWINLDNFLTVPLGFILDDLSKTMLVLVTGVGALIHIYSLGYMRDDEGKAPLLRLALPLHVLDARHRAREQLRDDVHLLGAGRRQFLSAHRPLVRARQRRGRGEQGVPHQSHWRFRVHARHSHGLDFDRLRRLQ